MMSCVQTHATPAMEMEHSEVHLIAQTEHDGIPALDGLLVKYGAPGYKIGFAT